MMKVKKKKKKNTKNNYVIDRCCKVALSLFSVQRDKTRCQKRKKEKTRGISSNKRNLMVWRN